MERKVHWLNLYHKLTEKPVLIRELAKSFGVSDGDVDFKHALEITKHAKGVKMCMLAGNKIGVAIYKSGPEQVSEKRKRDVGNTDTRNA